MLEFLRVSIPVFDTADAQKPSRLWATYRREERRGGTGKTCRTDDEDRTVAKTDRKRIYVEWTLQGALVKPDIEA